MSDSDSDGLGTNNVFTFQNESTLVSAKGPNINMNNITGISFRNNVFSSTMQMSQQYDRQRYAKSSYDPRSLSHRRPLSPMSVRSASDMRHRNINYSFNRQGMGGSRAAFNGRSGSPMSVRTIDSTASVSAVDIANALKYDHFNEFELEVIKEACNKFKQRNRVIKKHNYRRFRRKKRCKTSGYDSGEQGSASSLSSDDRSVRTSLRDNMSSCRSTITDISSFKRKLKGSNIFKDRTDYLKHNSSQSVSGGPRNWNTTQSVSSLRSMPAGSNMSTFRNVPLPVNFNNIHEKESAPEMTLKDRFRQNGTGLLSERFNRPLMTTSINEYVEKDFSNHTMQTKQTTSTISQKDRFNSGYLYPAQRFNRSGMPPSIPENRDKEFTNETHAQNGHLPQNNETDSDEEIFSKSTKENQTKNVKRKRNVDEDNMLPNNKRTKTLSPCKNSLIAQKHKLSSDESNDFIFAKPTCPARKSVKEKIISKCAAPLSDAIPQVSPVPANIQLQRPEKPEEEKERIEDTQSNNSVSNSSNLSMRPSFIKRKLFSQRNDMSEKQNLSIENSPQNNYAIQKDKHKARKLQQATTQSCLSRDIQQDNSNLLDLIHKIVPKDQMNITNQTNKTGSLSKNMTEDDDKWDAISTISARKDDDNISETFTDEEILNSTVKELQKEEMSRKTGENTPQTQQKVKDSQTKKNTPKRNSPNKLKNCKVSLEKLPLDIKQLTMRQFWDTDFESDVECLPSPRINKTDSKVNESNKTDTSPDESLKEQGLSNKFNSTKQTIPTSFANFTFDTTQKFSSTLRIKSHRAPKRNKVDRFINEDAKSEHELNNLKHKTNEEHKSLKKTNSIPPPLTQIVSSKSKENVTKTDTRLPTSKKQTSKTDKENQSPQKTDNKKQTKSGDKNNRKENLTKNSPQQNAITKNKPQKETISKKAPQNETNPKKTPQKESHAKKISPKKNIEKKTLQKETINKKTIHHETNSKNTAEKEIIDKNKHKKTVDKNKKTVHKDMIPLNLNTSNCKKPNPTEKTHPKNTCNSNKKLVESKALNTKNKQTNSTKKVTQKNNSIFEDNINKSNRPMRSCRANSMNRTADKSIIAENESMNRTLRSRKLDSSISKTTKTVQKNIQNYMLTRLSDVSFSLPEDKFITAKRAIAKTNLLPNNADESDVSFSLSKQSPTPRKTRSRNASRNNTLNTPVRKNALHIKDLLISNRKPNRKRTPNKRYVF